jgi:hypothetical protein
MGVGLGRGKNAGVGAGKGVMSGIKDVSGKKGKGKGISKDKGKTGLLDQLVPERMSSLSSAVVSPSGTTTQQPDIAPAEVTTLVVDETEPPSPEANESTLPLPAVVEIPPPPRDEL